MIIKSLQVQNFRSILDETLNFDDITALVGANGAGKSSFLHAIELFQSNSPKITIDDFYDKNTDNKITFKMIFKNLSDDAKNQFSSYIYDEELVVDRIFTYVDDKTNNDYYGYQYQHFAFKIIKEKKANEARPYYEILQKQKKYASLSPWVSKQNAENEMANWESKHPDECKLLRVDKPFTEFKEIMSVDNAKYIKFVYIGAVRDASSDANEGKESPLTNLMDIVIRNELMQRKEIIEFEIEYKKKYAKIMDKKKLKLPKLVQSINEILENYVPDAKIEFCLIKLQNWKIDMPEVTTTLTEDGYNTSVERSGHGLQRAYIMSILQYLSMIRNYNEEDQIFHKPILVLIIEEPELYQHPNRQRHIAKIFLDLISNIDEKYSTIQIVYGTHSPYFVGLDRIDQLRILKKQINNQRPKITKIHSTNKQKLVNELSLYYGHKFNQDNIISRLNKMMNQWINEGFFSKSVVLVEGDTDRAVILGTSNALNIDLDSNGISIIPCDGKNNLAPITIIFRQLKIPTYVIWDSDNNSSESSNLILLNLFKQTYMESGFVENNCAMINGKLETMLNDEIGEKYLKKLLDDYNDEHSLRTYDIMKNPIAIQIIMKKLINDGKEIPVTLRQILEKIQKMNQNQ